MKEEFTLVIQTPVNIIVTLTNWMNLGKKIVLKILSFSHSLVQQFMTPLKKRMMT